MASLAIALVVTICVVVTLGLIIVNTKNGQLAIREEQISSLKSEVTSLKNQLKQQGATQEELDRTRNELKRTQSDFDRQKEAYETLRNQQDPSVARRCLLDEIQGLYDRLTSPQIEKRNVRLKDFSGWEDRCREFARKYPNHDATDRITALADWLGKVAANGRVRFVPVKFVGKPYWGTYELSYKIEVIRSVATEKIKPIEGSEHVAGEFAFDKTKVLELAWAPAASVQILVRLGDATGTTLFMRLDEDAILRGEDKTTRYIETDKSCKFEYRIERIGFEALPPRP